MKYKNRNLQNKKNISGFCGLLQRTKNNKLLSRLREHLTILGRKERKSMTNDGLRKNEFLNTVDTQKIEGSLLLLTKKKIILPERKIIVEKPEELSLLRYQLDIDGEFGRTSTGIILSR